MSTDTFGGCCILIGGLLGLIIGWGWGTERLLEKMQKDAIAAGVAHWTIDPKTGEPSFRYITGDQRAGDAPAPTESRR